MKDINSPKNLYFDVHVFCCINERTAGHPRGSCSLRGSIALQEYMKARAKDLKSNIRLRINKSGCLDRCELGPVMVIYPEGVWYHYDDENDIDEILESHIAKGVLVDRLLIDSKQRTLPPKKSERHRLKVSAVEEFAHDICRYELTSADGADLPLFEPGAHIDLFTGQGLRRSYSLAGDSRDRKKYVLGVRREKPSRGGSDWLIDQLSVGDSVEASSPANNFPVDWSASHHLLIAGGIGITPMMAMGHEMRQRGASFHLYFCAPDEAHAPFLDEIKSIFDDRHTIHFDNGDPTQGIPLTSLLSQQEGNAHVYVCGPPGLVTAVRESSAHWTEGATHWEQFVPALEAVAKKNDAFEIVLSRQNLTLTVGEDETILQAIRKAGVEIESSCEDGLCGCCRVNILGGVPEHRDLVLTDLEKSDNQEIMICISRAKAGETLILDL